MITTYFRSSSLNNWNFCQQQYYLTYVLGLERQPGRKANMGTATHKVLEVLANLKKESEQVSQPEIYIYDDALGKVEANIDTWLKEEDLTSSQIDKINKSRINKYVYKTDASLSYDHSRRGVDLVEDLIQRASDYYELEEPWTRIERKHINNWTWMALEYKNGLFDPRLRNIVDAEPHFDIPIEQDWAKYSYNLHGQKIEGTLAIKGTIDLITEVSDGIYEIVDWKTGQRLDWATGTEKTYEKLQKDTQLMLYYYAARHLYPEVDNIMVTIFFIRDGGPFTVSFDDFTMYQVEQYLHDRYKEINSCLMPEMIDPTQKDFKCNKLCDFYKMESPCGSTNMCRFINRELKRNGMVYTTEMYKNPDFKIGKYEAPG